MSITITKKLDMVARGVPPTINLSQYDSDFTLVFALYASTGTFTVESGTTAIIRGTKKSGNGYSADATLSTITIAGVSYPSVTVTGDNQMTVVAGKNNFEITLKKSDKELSSANFILLVERAPLDADTIIDETVLRELDAIIDAADRAEDAADAAAESAAEIDFRVDAVPTQGSSNAAGSGGVYDAIEGVNDQLNKIGTEIDITELAHFTQGGGVQYNYEGKITSSTTASWTDYIDVSKFDKVRLTMRLNVNSSSYGIAFYKEPNLSDGSFLGGVQENYGAEQASAEVRTIDIPGDANYIRTTWIKNDQPHYSDYTFSCVGITNGRIGELEDNVSNLIDVCDSLESVRIPLYPNQFIGNAYKNASGAASDNDHCIVTERPLVFKNYGSVHVYTTNNNLSFSWKLSTDSALKTGIKDFRFSGDVELQLNILTDDSTPVKASDLNSIIMETNETVYNHYIADNFFKPTTSNRFDDYGGDNVHRYGMYNTGDQIGFAQRGNAYYRITSMPCVCDHDLTIYCGINNSLNLEILVNGILITIQYGQWFKVPKNTVFAVAFKSTSRNSSNNISTSGIYIIDDSVPSADITQYISQAVVTRADCGFMVDDKVFLISSTGLYSVYGSGAFLVTDATLDHTAGHANSCNYYDGKVYVSDWTDNTLIHVYDVDAENNALTYNKDIVIPIENVGRVEYFVRNDENEVFFIGWQNGDSSVNPNTLIYGLYVLTTDGYELSWIRKAFRPKVLQSFTMQGNNIYMVECDTNYKTTGIIILNLETGLSSFSEAIGTITTFESETIIPIGLQSFMLADSRGRLFVKTVVL